ncbi:MAG: hypothetical protein GX279_09530 [Clostridiaceae bacterium]|nr:hypothetical protein [Clostridiaceae bacterium]
MNENLDKIDAALGCAARFEKAAGTATAITLAEAILSDGCSKTFIAKSNNNGSSTTINGKPLYKPGTTSAPSLVTDKAYTVWFDESGDCFFLKASAEGTAVAEHVLAGTTFSNDNDTGIVGSMTDNGPASSETINLTSHTQEYTIAKGYHSGLRKIKAVISGLIASVIKAGTNVGGVVGTFTNDATATASQILNGITAYVNGNKITGNIPSKTAATITPNTTNQTITAGQYLSGAQTIASLGGNAPQSAVRSDYTFSSDASGRAKAGTMPVNGSQTATLSITGSGKPTKTIPAGYTSGGTITAQLASSLASKIQNGETIGGVLGTYKGLSPIASIQRGYLKANAVVVDVPINAVDLNRAIVIAVPFAINYEANTQTSLVSAELTSATNISLKIKTLTSSYIVRVYWTVIEFNNIKSIQRGDTKISGTNTYIDINLVDPDKCMVFCTQRADGTSGLTGNEGMAYMLDSHLEFNSGTRAILYSYATGSRPKIIHWQIVEFN